jgi:hypothetical protein
MDRTALLVLLFLALSHGAEARASGRVAAAVPIYVDDHPYSQRCRAAKKTKATRTASDAPLSISGERNASSRLKCEVAIGSKNVRFFGSTGSSRAFKTAPFSIHHLVDAIRLTARARDHRNDRRADGAAGRLQDSRHGHHAAPLRVRNLDRVCAGNGLQACIARDLWR